MPEGHDYVQQRMRYGADHSFQGCADRHWHSGEFRQSWSPARLLNTVELLLLATGSLGLTFGGVIFEAFVLRVSLLLVLGFVFSFYFGLACCDGAIRRGGPGSSEAGRARGLRAWAAIEVSAVGSMNLASLEEYTLTVWIGGELRLPFRIANTCWRTALPH